jgi:hypothetical protein
VATASGAGWAPTGHASIATPTIAAIAQNTTEGPLNPRNRTRTSSQRNPFAARRRNGRATRELRIARNPRGASSGAYRTLRVRALSATTTVDTDISTAPAAGLSTMPTPESTPAAKGIATTLYPVAHTRFWIILP